MTLGDRVARAREAIAAAGIRPEDASLDAEVLARKLLACDRAGFVVRLRDEEPGDFADAYRALVARRCRREPIAYILGEREFWGLPFEVTPDVLIPRPETELIVEEALELFPAGQPPGVIVDAGTGSGCLAVALALEFEHARVIATDISGPALAVARRNAARNGAGHRIDFREGNLLEPVMETADLIVSNPPYVASGDEAGLVPEVRDHEPHVALFGGGDDGLTMVERVVREAPALLRPGGHLVFEFGFGQEVEVEALVKRSRALTLLDLKRDIQGIARTAVARRT